METTISVASRRGDRLVDAPSVVSVVTAEEIETMGARDLIDVLRKVPGLAFAADVQGVTGVSMRGIFNEGKLLLMLDGVEMNELMYGTLQFGGHYPVDTIKRIEIIRGPGSVLYGGFAELGVINVVSKSAADLEGVAVSGLVSRGDSFHENRSNATIQYAEEIEDVKLQFSALVADGERSNREFADFFGGSYDMDDNSALSSRFFNAGFKYKGLSLRAIYDDYTIGSRDAFFMTAPREIPFEFSGTYLQANYEDQLSNAWNYKVSLNYKRQSPFTNTSETTRQIVEEDPASYDGLFFDGDIYRASGQVEVTGSLTKDLSMVIGAVYYEDKDKNIDLKLTDVGVFSEVYYRTNFANLTAGLRWDNHSQAEAEVVPRFSISKSFDNFHFKLLLAESYRTPVSRNVFEFKPTPENQNIQAETAKVYEFEIGTTVSNSFSLSTNFFRQSIEDPIIYFFDIEDGDSFQNFERITTQGVEFEARYSSEKLNLIANYSYYELVSGAHTPYSVYDQNLDVLNGDQLTGVAPHKVSLQGNVSLVERLTLNSSLVVFGEKYAYMAINDEDLLIAEKLDVVALWDLNFRYTPSDNVSLVLGGHNLLDEDVFFVQPYYDGFHAPLPGAGRTFFGKVSYSFR